ncbi:hypothetical protein P3K79_11295, partial [Bacillus anthracis]|uniref:hypothetical protein n=1 Tax=Bacillus anthracis TaxID=1392 RepID=UPI003B986C35
VSSAGVWIGYFAFEKGTERFTTQDIRISLGNDVKQGNIPIENYIAEFDKLKKQIDALQIAVDKANVVKKTGDIMTGSLYMDVSASNRSFGWKREDGKLHYIYGGYDAIALFSEVSNKSAWQYNPSTDTFNVNAANTNLLKKTGDTMTGQLTINRPGTKDATLILQNGGGLMRVMPYEGDFNYIQSGTLDSKAKSIYVTGYNISEMDKFQVKAKELIVEGTFKQSNDVAWTNLTLINGATTDAGNTPRYMRQGDVIYIVGAVTNVTDSMTIANLPTGLRPTSNCAFAVAYLSTDSKKYAGEINVRPDGRITLDWMWNNVKSVSFCISYHL